MEEKIGVINEVGDLGLGFTELTEDQKKVIKENESKEENKK